MPGGGKKKSPPFFRKGLTREGKGVRIEEKYSEGETMKEKEKTKKAGRKKALAIALYVLISIVCLIPALCVMLFVGVFVAISYLFTTPFERKRYKRSAYFGALQIRYRWGITAQPDYRLYEAARRENLPLTRRVLSGKSAAWYLWRRESGDIAVIPASLTFLLTDGEWLASADLEAEEPVPLARALKRDYAEEAGEIALPVKILAEHSDFPEKGDFAEAKKSPAFLVWEKKRPLTEALRLSPEGGLTLAEEEEAADGLLPEGGERERESEGGASEDER